MAIPFPSLSPDDRRGAFRLLFFALMVVGVGNSMLFAVLPPLARALTLSEAMVGAIFALSALIWVFSSPFWGRFSDTAGRKAIVALGLLAYGVSMSLFAAVVQVGLAGWLTTISVFVGLILARAIFGAVGSAANPAAQAYVADRTRADERTRELAALTAAFALGSAVGPGVCALIAARLGLVAPIWLTAGLAFASAFAVWRFLPGGGRPPKGAAPAVRGASWRLARDPRVSGHMIYGCGLSLVTGTLAQTYAFFVIDRLNLPNETGAEVAATGLMVGALGLLAAQTAIVPRVTLRPRALMGLGATLTGVGVLVQVFAMGLGPLIVSQLLQGLGFGLARPGFAGGASMAVSPKEQGSAAGLVVACNGAGFIASPLSGGLAYQMIGPTAPLWISLVVLAAMAAFAARSRRLAAPAWRDSEDASA